MKNICTYCYFPVKRFFNGSSIQLNSGNSEWGNSKIWYLQLQIWCSQLLIYYQLLIQYLQFFILRLRGSSLFCTITIIILVKINLSLISYIFLKDREKTIPNWHGVLWNGYEVLVSSKISRWFPANFRTMTYRFHLTYCLLNE